MILEKKREKEPTINNWLTDEYDYERPQRGEIREGVLLELDNYGAIVDVGLKHDGIVPVKMLSNWKNLCYQNWNRVKRFQPG